MSRFNEYLEASKNNLKQLWDEDETQVLEQIMKNVVKKAVLRGTLTSSSVKKVVNEVMAEYKQLVPVTIEDFEGFIRFASANDEIFPRSWIPVIAFLNKINLQHKKG